jgi:hypothetical protein
MTIQPTQAQQEEPVNPGVIGHMIQHSEECDAEETNIEIHQLPDSSQISPKKTNRVASLMESSQIFLALHPPTNFLNLLDRLPRSPQDEITFLLEFGFLSLQSKCKTCCRPLRLYQ